ncbi:MAG: ComEA family DNA-binding protein [Bosea sp. (in: a-proteobacteria)]
MISTRLLAGAAAIMMAASPVLAQTAAPVAPTAPVPARPAAPTTAQPAAPAAPTRPATPATAPAAAPAAASTAQGQRVNLNTAGQADLDKLPQIGDARAKAILAERAKGRFTNWDNFVQRMTGTTVNQTAKDAIKDKVSF